MEKEIFDFIKLSESENWWYKGRRDLISKLNINKENKILEIGCGTGSNLEIFKNKCHIVIGIDNNIYPLNFAKEKGINIVLADASHLPFKPNIFDWVFMLDVIEHIQGEHKVLKEINNVLKTQAKLVITAPAFNFLWNENDVYSHHFRRYTKKELIEKISKHGFVIKKSSYWNFFLFFPVLIYVLFEKLRTKKKKIIRNNLELIPSFLNNFLYNLIKLENILIYKFPFPLGTSVFIIAYKKDIKKSV